MASSKSNLAVFNGDKFLYDILRAGALDHDFDKEIAALPTCLERFDKLYDRIKSYLETECQNIHNKKDNDKAENCRKKGEEYRLLGNLSEALLWFNKSLTWAETKEELALTYANRSKVFYAWSMGPLCIKDMNRALQNNCPEKLKTGLLKGIKKAESLKSFKEQRLEVPSIYVTEKNKKIQSAADCIKMATNRKFGQHIIATKDISIGDVIMVEEPFVAVTEEGNMVHCFECFKLCYNVIPCDNCTQVLYCDEECKKKAENYHKYECEIRNRVQLTKLKPTLSQTMMLAFKLTYVMRNHLGKMENYKKRQNIYRSDRYNEVYNLFRSINSFNSVQLVMKLVYPTVLTFHILKTFTDFFDVDDSEAAQKDFKLLMYENAAIVEFNIRLCTELLDTDDGFKQVAFAYGIYPAMSRFNHSCCQNVTHVSYGAAQVLQVTRTIKKGEQCFINYGNIRDKPTNGFITEVSQTAKLFRFEPCIC